MSKIALQVAAAIDVTSSKRDRAAAKTGFADVKLLREKRARTALQEIEADRLAVVAKTRRLRAARLALQNGLSAEPH
jgi:hypothetical protein